MMSGGVIICESVRIHSLAALGSVGAGCRVPAPTIATIANLNKYSLK